ncbi:hypothetical protein [Anaeroselena agilis]|uniref:DUF7973 domain-containing protein n=1 Tax=Anaeroselena agilis TaxID=3063788 RepID=A0ABU3NS99_9FIRM|nr:hypothetical protein [Selenomonadales bacterium 4137-cl]
MFPVPELVAAFGSGMFAAAVGALPAFIMCGFLVLANMPEMAFGPYFGPHISFAGAVAATAFAGRKDLVNSKDILVPLVKCNNGSVLFVGGLFAVGGMMVNKLLAHVATPADTIAMTVGLSGIAAGLIFGRGKLVASYKLPDSGTAFLLLLLGLGVGLISAYAAVVGKNVLLGFGVAAASLIFLQFMGVGPVTHHIALPAAYAAAAVGNVWIGGLFELWGPLWATFSARR